MRISKEKKLIVTQCNWLCTPYPKWDIYICTHIHMHICIYIYIYTHTHTYIYIYIYTRVYAHTHVHIYIYIYIIMSCHQHGYPWPSLTTPSFHSSFLAGSQGYIPYLHRAAVCRFELIALFSLSHVRGSIGAHHLWEYPWFSSSVLDVWFI